MVNIRKCTHVFIFVHKFWYDIDNHKNFSLHYFNIIIVFCDHCSLKSCQLMLNKERNEKFTKNTFCRACLIMVLESIVWETDQFSLKDQFYDCFVYNISHSLLVFFINKHKCISKIHKYTLNINIDFQ